MTIVLANKLIMMCSFSLLSVSVMISSLNDNWKPFFRKHIAWETYYKRHEMIDFTIQKSQFLAQPS